MITLLVILLQFQTPLIKSPLSSDEVETSIAFTPNERTAYVSKHNGKWGSRENPPSKIYAYELRDGEWVSTGIAPFSDSDTDDSDSDIFISYDGQEAFFVTSRTYKGKTDSNPDIWKSKRINDRWSEPVPLIEVNSPGYEASPVTDADGNLYFSSIRPEGNGLGDLYLARLKTDGSYQDPTPLKGEINAESGEWNLLVSPGADWIIFESSGRNDGLSPYGDFYLSKKQEEEWSAPVHVKELNSTGSDLNARLLVKSNTLVFISSLKLESPGTDIYMTDGDIVEVYLVE